MSGTSGVGQTCRHANLLSCTRRSGRGRSALFVGSIAPEARLKPKLSEIPSFTYLTN